MATKKVEKVKSKDELLAGVIKDIEKEYGKGSIMKLGIVQQLMLNRSHLAPYF